MLPHIKIVVAIPLVKAHGGQHFGDDRPHHLGEVVQHPLHILPLQQLRQFLADTLRRHIGEVIFQFYKRSLRLLLNGETQRSGKPQRPQDAEGILGKPLLRRAHTPQNALL